MRPGPPIEPRRVTLDELRLWVAGRGKHVLTFLGYSGAGYETPDGMLADAEAVLASHDPDRVIVNVGATAIGIGAVYVPARQRGFETLGIVSSRALKGNARWSPAVDHVFVIEDDTWGGTDADGHLHPTSAAIVAVSDELVAIGGGDISRAELWAGRGAGKPCRFIPAEFEHELALRWAREAGRSAPSHFASVIGEAAWRFP
ncbi:hypothetical protein [Piscinibacter gummiphilus]|uniref:Uncharacterized protein n=1 Tax=Piscinibacter gummiphilus TaxID=946333 RepID=A0A1W6LCU9_9BURK|nr:hypothetical protein [Piscinibacter gummiphilus]ARN22085.1 hypothetical protein A4W93_20490 [Piscinibacter gummiphilus]ATU66774.1 hypothetical protein CPZ87_20585 [Piscinibacter gummiphilus]GLS94169.1 hypothetical protein GCM10007918_14610 [Piscinibacter gummiphilus]